MVKLRNYIISHKNPIIAFAVSTIFALLIFAPNLFNQSVPSVEDVRSHLFKIDFLYSHLSQGQWPGWNPYWYDGVPFDPFYPPGFYFLGAIVTFLTKQALISYKLLIFLTMISNGLAIYYFSRKFLKISPILGILCLIAFESSTPLLMNYMYGTVPDLLGWTICVIFLTQCLSNVLEGKVSGINNVILPGFLFGITILIHPFPAIFAVLAVIVFYIICLFYQEHRNVLNIKQIQYFFAVFFIGIVISTYYWLPFLTLREYVSPIYTSLNSAWDSGIQFTIILIIFSLTTGLFIRLKKIRDIRLDILIVFVILSAALGFGLVQSLPLGSLIHSFRFATIMLPFFCILLIGYSLDIFRTKMSAKKSILITIGVLLLLVSSIAPFYPAYTSNNLNNLFSYVQNYRQPGYAQTLKEVQDGRLIVPIAWGGLMEGDSPVTFSWHYGVETVNGPYNQGDPKFFKDTVHLEWEQRWLHQQHTRENLMQENAATYIFIRGINPSFSKKEDLTQIIINAYGQIWAMNEPVSRAVNVTPILLDVSDEERVTEFFNILIPQGYRMVFANAELLDKDIINKFDYVMTDNVNNIDVYEDKTVFFLTESDNVSVAADSDNPSVINLNLPYLSYTEKYFYQGDRGDSAAWNEFNFDINNQLSMESIIVLKEIGAALNEYIIGLKYHPAEYLYTENNIEVTGEPGFILVKDGYFPYWQPEQGTLLSTNQGFMLIYNDYNTTVLNYRIPFINILAASLSIASLLASICILVILKVRRQKHNNKS